MSPRARSKQWIADSSGPQPSKRRSQQSRPRPSTPRSARRRSGAEGGINAAILALKLIILFCVVIFVYFYNGPLLTYLQAGLQPYEQAGVPESVNIIVERVLTFEVEKAGIHYNLTIPYPNDAMIGDQVVQEIQSVDVDPPFDRIQHLGIDDYMVWEDDLEPGDKIEIRIRYEFLARSVKWDITRGKAATVDTVPEGMVEKYCKNEWPVSDRSGEVIDENGDGIPDQYRIEPGNAAIKELAEQLTKDDGGDVYKMAKSIYDFLNENFVYVRGTSGAWPQSAMESYQTLTDGDNIVDGRDRGKGDCDDQSILFISLCRAVGIPAWLESGALYNKPTNQWEGHGWANVYVPLRNGESRVATVDVVNNIFFFRDTDRLSEWVDNGNETRLNEYYTQWKYTYRGSIQPELTTSDVYYTIKYDPHAQKTQITI